jgi:predicted dehydrogenase
LQILILIGRPKYISALLSKPFKELEKRQKSNKEMWKYTKIFASYLEALDETKPDAAFIGVPPYFHGTTESPRDIEIQCARRNIHMFIEKPLSCSPLDETEQVAKILEQAKGIVVSVGYMFRYRFDFDNAFKM